MKQNMLLFLISVGLPELVILVFLMSGLGILIYRVTKKMLRTRWKGASDKRIKIIARCNAFILAPVIVIGPLVLFIYGAN